MGDKKSKWDQLSLSQKAGLIKIYVNNGFSDIDSIREDYNKNIENFQSNDANFVQILRNNDPKYVQNADGSVSTHKLNYATDDKGAIIYPSVQEHNGTFVDHSEDNMGGLESAIQQKDTVRTSIPFAEWYTKNYKKDYNEFFNRYNKFAEKEDEQTIIPVNIKEDGGGLWNILKSIFRINKDNNNNTEYISYFDAPVELRNKAHLPNRIKKFNTESTSEYGDSHYDVFEARYIGLKKAMQDASIPEDDIERLLPFVITQNILEGGYRLKRDDNNFGGMMISKGNENIGRMKFKTPEEYYKKYIQNLDKKWGDEYLGENNGWRHAKSIEDYARILNREDLELTTEDRYNEYNLEHPNNPAYLYTPEWKNNYKPLMHSDRFGGIYPRVNAYMTLLNDRINAFNKYAKDNNLVK